MKYFIRILSLFLLFSFSTSSFAKEDVFRAGVTRMISLGKSIEQEHKTDARIILQMKRDKIVEDIQELYTLFIPRIGEKPTLDISASYRLVLQKYALSCEIAAMRMVMESITKKSISEEKIFSHLPIFPKAINDAGIWGDPEKGFVGSYTGSQRMRTGYGIYEAPLLAYLETQGMSGLIFNTTSGDDGMSPQQRLTVVLESIANGDRVILWGDYCTRPVYDDGMVKKIDKYILRFFPLSGKNTCDRSSQERKLSWKTQDDTIINALSGEHTFILLGYLGSLVNPTHIIVWDTSTGKHFYTTSEWMRKWESLNFRTLIVRNLTPKR